MQALFDRHPFPWTCDGVPFCTSLFVKDANGKTVVLVSAFDSETVCKDEGGAIVSTIIERPIPTAKNLVNAIIALPELLQAVTDAHAHMEARPSSADGELAARLETLIERLA